MKLKLTLVLLSLVQFLNTFTPPDIQRRFEYKLSFKGPHLTFKDGTIPFWDHSGSAIPSNDQIRITPSIKSQKGRIWSKNRMSQDEWEIDVTVRINGRGRVGADGMAIWYTDKPGLEGPVFGSNDHWIGLGIFLDSFDNDAQQNNPYIMVMTNDGTQTYDHNRDGITQQQGGCLRDFRNKPFPVHIKVEYYKKVLTVYYHGGLNSDLSSYEICTRVENVELPKNGYFGVSAATGGLADDHDVLAFITHSLIDNNAPNTATLPTDEQKKYDKEYEEFMKQLETEKEKYRKDHPETAEEIDERKVFEGEGDRQFRNILDVQNSIHNQIRSLDTKMAEIVGRQEQMFSLLSSQPQVGGSTQQIPNQQGSVGTENIKREEVVLLINQQNELTRTIRDIYASVSEMHRKTNFVADNIAASRQQQQLSASQQPPIASQQQANQIDPHMINQIHEGVKGFRLEMANALRANQVRCPETTGCLSTFYFLLIIGAQTTAFIIYFILKNRSDNQMKKFY